MRNDELSAADAARIIRREIKKRGYNPKGMVHVAATDYTTEVCVHLRGLRPESVDEITDYIDEMGNSRNYFWNVV